MNLLVNYGIRTISKKGGMPVPTTNRIFYHSMTSNTVEQGAAVSSNSGTYVSDGFQGNGLRFANSGQTLVYNSVVIPIGSSYTIRLKFKPLGIPQVSYGGILLTTSSGASSRAGFKLTGNGTSLPLNLNVGVYGFSAGVSQEAILQFDTWYDIVVRVDASDNSLELWLDGEQLGRVESTSPQTTSNAVTLRIGQEGGFTNNSLNGIIDEVEIWNIVV